MQLVPGFKQTFVCYESQLSSLAEVAHCERSENRGSGGQRAETSQFEAVPQPFGVATVVGFAANVPGQLGDGGVRFPTGPCMDVHWGGQNRRKAMEKLE